MGSKKFKRRVGDIVKIALEDGSLCFGHILEEPLVAFYDIKANTQPPIEAIVRAPVLFKVWVMNNAITSGRWEVVGHQELDDILNMPVSFFKQDPITREVCLYLNAEEISATREQCKDLERAAVWNPEHIEDRLRDHYWGIPNKWAESLKMK